MLTGQPSLRPQKAMDLMTRDVLSVGKDERLESVLELLRTECVSKVVVTDGPRIAGVLTDGDIADELGARKNRGVPASHLHASSAMRRSFPRASPDTPVEQIVALLAEGAGLVPIVHDDVCVGIITASDAMRLVRSDASLADVMTQRDLHVVSPDDRVVHARRVMMDTGVERLPVLDGGKLVGLISESDVAQGLARVRDTVSDHHQRAALERFQVREIMVQTVVSATPETSVREAIETMRTHDVGCLPVVRAGRLVGIVTRTDLLRLAR